MRRDSTFAAGAVLLCLVCSGCNSSTITVYGTLMKKDAPYKVPDGQRLAITFYAMEGPESVGKPSSGEEPYPATFNPVDASFTVPGQEGYGIPPGKYRICLVQKWKRDSLPEPKPGDRKIFDRDTDLLNNQYAPGFSPIIREITASGRLIVELNK